MIQLPTCRHRGRELTPGRYVCRSPKLLVSPEGVTAALCAGCYCRDHADAPAEPTPPPARGPCLHLGRVIDREGSACSLRWIRACEGKHGQCTAAVPRPGTACCLTCPDYEEDG